MYTHLLIVFASSTCCLCYVNYEIFNGFTMLPSEISEASPTEITAKEIEPKVSNQERKKLDLNTTSNETNINKESSWSLFESSNISSRKPDLGLSELLQEENDTLFSNFSSAPLKHSKFKCPEQESPSNIGPYEVPTQRDLVLHIRGTLTKMFNSYHEKALYFLKDISQATKSTKDVEKKCQGNKSLYRKCIKQVSSRCEFITKNLVTSLEMKRQDVLNLNSEEICELAEMKANPVKLIKILAMEEASLEFALPGLLRQLHECSQFYCSNSQKNKPIKKPMHHISDQELIVRFHTT